MGQVAFLSVNNLFYLNKILMAKEWAEQGAQSNSGLPDKRKESEKTRMSTKGYRDFLMFSFSSTDEK